MMKRVVRILCVRFIYDPECATSHPWNPLCSQKGLARKRICETYRKLSYMRAVPASNLIRGNLVNNRDLARERRRCFFVRHTGETPEKDPQGIGFHDGHVRNLTPQPNADVGRCSTLNKPIFLSFSCPMYIYLISFSLLFAIILPLTKPN